MTKPIELSEIIGGYVLERVLGRGGMGTVYLGRHKLLGRPAAVKVLEPELAGNDQVISRFFHEAKIVNDVRHPNIVDVIDFVRTENPRRVAFIMEYLEGDSLDRFLKEIGPLPVHAALNVVIQILDGLAAVHAIGVVHRDLKPANLRFTNKVIGDASSVPIVKILDFGIAKASGPMVAHKTQTGLVMGTPAYMAPEQVSGEAVSTLSDIYAVGEILYELVGGQRLFSGTNTEVLRAKLASEPPAIELPEGLAGRDELAAVIRRCVAFEATQRPATGELIQLLADLRPGSFGAVPRQFDDAGKPTTLMPTPAPVRARGTNPTPAPLKPPAVTHTYSPSVAEPPAAMNTLAAEKSLYGTQKQKSLMPLAAGVAFLAAGAVTTFILTQQQAAPIIVHAVEEDPPALIEPPSAIEPPPVQAEVEPEQEREPDPIKKKKKRRKERRVAPPPVVAPPPPPPPAEATFGRIKVTAWTTAGRQVPATVKIDGRAVGRTAPLEIKARAGKRKVEVEAVGHPPKIQEVMVKDGETAAIDVVVDLR